MLKFFVGVVDAKLFEAVDLESFKTIDVEHADELVRFGASPQGLVDLDNNPVEKVGINALSQSISGKQGLKNNISISVKRLMV